MSPDNIASGLRNMVDDIEKFGAAPLTVDTSLLREAIAALTPPEGFVLVPVEPTEAMVDAGRECGSKFVYERMIAARPEAK